jgi:hypothetical protein
MNPFVIGALLVTVGVAVYEVCTSSCKSSREDETLKDEKHVENEKTEEHNEMTKAERIELIMRLDHEASDSVSKMYYWVNAEGIWRSPVKPRVVTDAEGNVISITSRNKSRTFSVPDNTGNGVYSCMFMIELPQNA